MTFILIGLAILGLRIGQDTLFLAKIDAFNRDNKVYSMAVNFVEAMYGITVIKIILGLMDRNHFFVLIFGVGSVLGGLVSSAVKRRLDDRLEGQRKFFARISLENDIDRTNLIETLRNKNFAFTMETRDYLDGQKRTVIQGS
ncbi:MAG: hypothetical protein RQ801_07600, partial [Spirochaetaceae bacterium]|nr:hypothetical protein [Spirochaetaceae bacterium]